MIYIYDPNEHVKTFKDLCNIFLQRYAGLVSDGVVTENETIPLRNTTGATLTCENVIRALEEHNEGRTQ